jgi:hypothetical protein
MAIYDPTKKDTTKYHTIDGKEIPERQIKEALQIADHVKKLHALMSHGYIDPPLY